MLEIMIAVAILATSMVTLMSLHATSLLSSGRAQQMSIATLLARQKMAEVEIEVQKDLAKNKFPSQEIEKDGAFEEPFEDYRWKYTMKKVEIPVIETEVEGSNALVGSYIKNVMEEFSKSVREIQLTIFWGDSDQALEDQPNLVVTTHVVKLK